ncbi:hypothetical protein PN39_05545 [Vibrio anguillarum]|uniref:hypothetical protein n=4 Tax=Vibrio TaxID=662 RepID=UPI001C046401|nr:hypothetical protein [Vibrio anguillarum]EKH9212918.1 hypothetical protein [Vibrio parahaemolyticus]MBT2925339.1 hypothetical protein [Vibrio anguillarum]HCG7534094.1 hypothetical protein [Vibrio parahaemolyticus]HDY8168869.1 hypothetical protein [Vibrio vulnificus]
MSDIAKLTVALYANSAQFTSELKKSQKNAKTWSDSISKTVSVAAKATAAAATAAAGALALVYNQQAAIIDQTAKFADRIGISTEALTQFRHASELTGVGAKNLDMSLQRMTRRIAEAAQGSGEAAPALKQLGLDAKQLGEMTPDQQLYVLADAFTQVESQSERVRLAFKLFDSEGVGMVNMLAGGADGLRSMADEADRLGITLSRVDAAKVEMANDAMYKVGVTTTAVKQEITTQLAPIVAALADEFLNYSQQFGGMNNMIAEGIHTTTQGVGIMADSLRGVQIIIEGLTVAWEGFKIGFMVAAQAITTGLHELGRFIFNVVISPVQAALDLAGKFSDEAAEMAASLRQFSNMPPPELFDVSTVNQAKLDLNQAIWELRSLASEPLPSEGIEAWYQNTKSKFDQLAKDYAASINYNTPGATPLPKPDEKPAEEDKAVVAFRQATDQMEVEWQRRLAINAAGDQADTAREAFAYQDRMSRLSQQFQAAYEAANENQALQQELEDQYFASRELLWQEHQANLTDIEKKAAQARYAAQAAQLHNYSDLFGSMADIAGAFAGEQSGIYKAMFAASKAFAIAESIIKIQQGIASAAALPFPANIPAMATVAASTASIVSTIQSTQLKGMAHNGISSVPKEGTWLLDKGERVYTNDSAKQLDQMYAAVMSGKAGQSGGSGDVVVKIENAPPGYVAQSAEAQEDEFGRKVIRVLLQDQQQGGDVTSGYQSMWGLQRQGRF